MSLSCKQGHINARDGIAGGQRACQQRAENGSAAAPTRLPATKPFFASAGKRGARESRYVQPIAISRKTPGVLLSYRGVTFSRIVTLLDPPAGLATASEGLPLPPKSPTAAEPGP